MRACFFESAPLRSKRRFWHRSNAAIFYAGAVIGFRKNEPRNGRPHGPFDGPPRAPTGLRRRGGSRPGGAPDPSRDCGRLPTRMDFAAPDINAAAFADPRTLRGGGGTGNNQAWESFFFFCFCKKSAPTSGALSSKTWRGARPSPSPTRSTTSNRSSVLLRASTADPWAMFKAARDGADFFSEIRRGAVISRQKLPPQPLHRGTPKWPSDEVHAFVFGIERVFFSSSSGWSGCNPEPRKAKRHARGGSAPLTR